MKQPGSGHGDEVAGEDQIIPSELDCVHTMPAQFKNGRKFDSKNSLQDFDAKQKMITHPV